MKALIFKYKIYYLRLISSRLRPSRSLSREEMILKYIPLIKGLASSVARPRPPHISSEDLVGAGVIGLMSALDKFDPQKGVRFKTYAEIRIRGAMLDELRLMDWASRSVRQKAGLIGKARLALQRKKGRAAEDEEIAQELGLSLDSYYKLANKANVSFLGDTESLGKRFPQPPDEDELNQVMYEKEDYAFHLLSLEELRQALAQAIEQLAPKEKTVISLYYYDELTYKQIGAVFGFTESRVCQIHKKAISKLKGKMCVFRRIPATDSD